RRDARRARARRVRREAGARGRRAVPLRGSRVRGAAAVPRGQGASDRRRIEIAAPRGDGRRGRASRVPRGRADRDHDPQARVHVRLPRRARAGRARRARGPRRGREAADGGTSPMKTTKTMLAALSVLVLCTAALSEETAKPQYEMAMTSLALLSK